MVLAENNYHQQGACSVAVSYKPPMLVTRARLPACAFWRGSCETNIRVLLTLACATQCSRTKDAQSVCLCPACASVGICSVVDDPHTSCAFSDVAPACLSNSRCPERVNLLLGIRSRHDASTHSRKWQIMQVDGHRAHPDLNQAPADLQSAALTTELCTRLMIRNFVLPVVQRIPNEI